MSQLIWLLPARDDAFEGEAARILGALGLQVRWAASLSELERALHTHKVTGIALSDVPGLSLSHESILELARVSPARKTRWVYLFHHPDPELARLAISFQFRDCIPLQLPGRDWAQRLKRAVFAHYEEDHDPNSVALTCRETLELVLPSQLIWLGPQRARIETYLEPAPGSLITVDGGIVHRTFHHSLQLRVERVVQNNLNYRFSHGVEGSWKVSGMTRDNAFFQMQQRAQASAPKKGRIYLVLRGEGLIAAITHVFSPAEFELEFALQTKSLIREPQFYSPDLVLIDTALFRSASGHEMLRRALANMPPQASVILIGGHYRRSHFPDLATRAPVQFLTVVSRHALGEIRRQQGWSSQHHTHTAAINFERGAEDASVHLLLPATLVQINIGSVGVESPHPIRKFAMLELRSSVLTTWAGGGLMVKVHREGSQPRSPLETKIFRFHASFCDLTPSRRERLGAHLLQHFAATLNDAESYERPPVATPAQVTQPTQMPKPRRLTPQISRSSTTTWGPAALALVVVGASLALLWAALPFLKAEVKRSGAPYTRSLQRFMKSNSEAERPR